MSSFIGKLQARLRKDESGFTLIELLIVLVIIGILLAIAVPSYLGFKARAETTAAESNIRAALPSAEAYYADNGSYTGMTETTLRAIDTGLAAGVWTITIPTPASYTLAWHKTGGACTGTVARPTPGTISTTGC